MHFWQSARRARYPAAVPFLARLTMGPTQLRIVWCASSLPLDGLAKRNGSMDAKAPLPTLTSDGLAVYACGSGPPLLLMPYPHAVSVVGDRNMDLLVDGLTSLGRALSRLIRQVVVARRARCTSVCVRY